MDISVKSSDKRVGVISLSGMMTLNHEMKLRQMIDELSESSSEALHADLSGVKCIDSLSLGLLLILRDHAIGAGLEVSLINCSEANLSILKRANFDKLFRSLS